MERGCCRGGLRKDSRIDVLQLCRQSRRCCCRLRCRDFAGLRLGSRFLVGICVPLPGATVVHGCVLAVQPVCYTSLR